MRLATIGKTVVLTTLALVLAAAVYILLPSPDEVGTTISAQPVSGMPNDSAPAGEDRFFAHNKLTAWWDRESLPGNATTQLTGLTSSNIHPDDYVGADACKKCHRKNHEDWSQHSHRWMNAMANESTVKGDFSGPTISYLGGEAKFLMVDGEYRMHLNKGAIDRKYRITQTIGARFFQYYVGKMISGPEPEGHANYAIDHVMPFGYWLDRNEWVPAVHIGNDELPDGEREDPFATTLPIMPLSPYFQCNSCHTTFALGDELTRNFFALGRHPPYAMHWNIPGFLKEAHSEFLGGRNPRKVSNRDVETLLIGMQQFEAPERAITLGVSCESCHLGCKDHAEGRQEKPSFFPVSPHLNVESAELPTGREPANVNWACGRCHAGERPYYEGGMSTWNSTEYTDATKGGCYSQLTCIDCHNPHQAIGSKWTMTESQNDESCLKCHEQLRATDALQAHTHHAADSVGSHCMNCHMPRLNEGLQDVVRTHTIFSPTNAAMLESNQLNACNICHVEESIDWTTKYLKDWYGAEFSEAKIRVTYPDRDGAVADGWLKSPNEAVRLAATDAVARSGDTSTVDSLIEILDDPFLLNRQFARVAIEGRFKIKLADFGYHFYMTPEERRDPVSRIRNQLLDSISE